MSLGAQGQLASPLPEESGPPGLLLSATREMEPGARAMILLAEDLFRLDVLIQGDTMRTIVRNLSAGELTISDGLHPEVEPHLVSGDISPYQPGQGRISFSLGAGQDQVSVEVIIGMLRFEERGTVRITAQAVIRQAAAQIGVPPHS